MVVVLLAAVEQSAATVVEAVPLTSSKQQPIYLLSPPPPRHPKNNLSLENARETYCKISFVCKNCHSACVAAGASGAANAPWGRGSIWVATAKSSRSFRFRDVTIVLKIVSITKRTSFESEKFALSFGASLTCTHCAWIEAAAINRRGRPQS